jgi:hypothetical protein
VHWEFGPAGVVEGEPITLCGVDTEFAHFSPHIGLDQEWIANRIFLDVLKESFNGAPR